MRSTWRAAAVASVIAVAGVARADTVPVDTHEHYAHTSVVDRSRFPWFRRVAGKQSVALTFDCGRVEPANATEILDALERNRVKATFFVSGLFLFANPAQGLAGGLDTKNLGTIRRMIDAGHEFGSHTLTHPHSSPAVDWVREHDELRRGWDAAVARIYAGAAAPANARLRRYWRAPFGEYDARALTSSSRAGFPFHFGWNVDVRDSTAAPDCRQRAVEPCLDPGRLTDFVLRFGDRNGWALDGFVVLAHLENRYRWGARADGLDRLIAAVRGKGHELALLSEMFAEPVDRP